MTQRERLIAQGAAIEPKTADEQALKKLVTAGIELPAVTASDNGKVLGVVAGKWAVMALENNTPSE